MTGLRLEQLLEEVARGGKTPAEAIEDLRSFPVENLGFAQVDHARPASQGYPEVVFCEGKTVDQILGICAALERANGSFLATRANDDVRSALRERFPPIELNGTARTAFLPPDLLHNPTMRGTVLVVSAGTSDLPVAEEAAVVARAMGNSVETVYDVGVAGIHRILTNAPALRSAAVIIVVAGMDGALASVVGGLVSVPVIAVPTSVGYGAAFGGVSALLAMLNSCASGVTVVNIDNGFGAAAAAARINRGGS